LLPLFCSESPARFSRLRVFLFAGPVSVLGSSRTNSFPNFSAAVESLSLPLVRLPINAHFLARVLIDSFSTCFFFSASIGFGLERRRRKPRATRSCFIFPVHCRVRWLVVPAGILVATQSDPLFGSFLCFCAKASPTGAGVPLPVLPMSPWSVKM
jgi:hypothetical protein